MTHRGPFQPLLFCDSVKYVQGPTGCHWQVSLSTHCCPVLPLLQLAWVPTSRDSVLAQHATTRVLRGSGPAYREQLLLSWQLLPRPDWTKNLFPDLMLAQPKLDLCTASSTSLPTPHPGGEEGRGRNEHSACAIDQL